MDDLDLSLKLPPRVANNLAEIARGVAMAERPDLDDEQRREWAIAAAQLQGAIEDAET